MLHPHQAFINWHTTRDVAGYRGECTACTWKGPLHDEDEREWAQDDCMEHEAAENYREGAREDA